MMHTDFVNISGESDFSLSANIFQFSKSPMK